MKMSFPMMIFTSTQMMNGRSPRRLNRILISCGILFLILGMVAGPQGRKEKIFFEAVVLMEQEFYDKALSRLDSVIILDPTQTNAYLMRGVCHQSLENDSMALMNFYAAKGLDGQNPEVIYFLAEAYQRQRSWDSVLKYYTITSGLDNNSSKSQIGLLRANSELDRWEEAKKNIGTLESAGYRGADLYYFGAHYDLSREDRLSARSNFYKARELAPNDPFTNFALAKMYYEDGDMDSSGLFIDQAILSKQDEYGEQHLLRAKINYHKEDTLHALIDLNEVIHLNPESGEAYMLRAPAKIYFGDSLGACEDINMAFSKGFSSDSSLYFLYNCVKK